MTFYKTFIFNVSSSICLTLCPVTFVPLAPNAPGYLIFNECKGIEIARKLLLEWQRKCKSQSTQWEEKIELILLFFLCWEDKTNEGFVRQRM